MFVFYTILDRQLADKTSLQITPAFVREAYNLLRQSIIHVELDDIDFDEEELEGERNRAQDQRERQQQQSGTEDVDMSGAADATDRLDESYNEAAGPSSPTRARGAGAQLAASPAPGTTPVPESASVPAAPRRKMKITHDRYEQLKSLVVYYILESEKATHHGKEREELVDWYLESREEDIHSVEELDYEKELFLKVLKRLVKVILDPYF